MASAYEMFETDETLETEGIIINYGEFRVKVAHTGVSNKKYQKMLSAKILKPYAKQLDSGTMDEELGAKLMRELIAECVVLDFEVLDKEATAAAKLLNPVAENVYKQGVPAKDGSVAPFNRKEVYRIFTELRVLYLDIKKQADDFANFKVVEQEAEIKN